jgi:aspartyl/asparaginyl-tRNA synthetase
MYMDKKTALICSELLHTVRNFFREENVPEIMFNKITSGTGACENVPTVFQVKGHSGVTQFLSQTDQLLIEHYIIKEGMQSAYTISRSFRDEPRVGDGRHLAEFSLCEYEARDMDLNGLIAFMQKQLRYICAHMAEADLTREQKDRLKRYAEMDYPVVSYDEVITKLSNMGVSIKWGDDLSSRDEEFICGIWGGKDPVPVMVTHYPESIKFFNMYESQRTPVKDDRYTVDCADFLLPHAGETWGSSRREVEYDRIRNRLLRSSMLKQLLDLGGSPTAFDEYLELFKDNSNLDRSGFGAGCGRIAQFVLGQNEVVPL